MYYGNRVSLISLYIVLYLRKFGFGLIKFSFSKAGLVFFLITGTANVTFLNPKLFIILSCWKKFKMSEILQRNNKPNSRGSKPPKMALPKWKFWTAQQRKLKLTM